LSANGILFHASAHEDSEDFFYSGRFEGHAYTAISP